MHTKADLHKNLVSIVTVLFFFYFGYLFLLGKGMMTLYFHPTNVEKHLHTCSDS
jgi:hypothetical protein